MVLPLLDAPAPEAKVVAVCIHGLGLGSWLFEPWLPTFHAAGISVRALTLPGHGADRSNVGMAELLDAVERVVTEAQAQSLPVAIVGHSIGGLLAQQVVSRRELHAAALVCPMPPGQIFSIPTPSSVKFLPESLPRLLAGKPYRPSWAAYRALGLNVADEVVARAFYERVTAWPNRLCRQLVRRPWVNASAVTTPVLVTIGAKDPMVPWQKGRLLGDLYEAVVWRYDDLSHSPTHEPGGFRMARDVAQFVVEPHRPQVIESEGYGPSEGIGVEQRRARRGELMKKRSAYGQKKAAR